ncbi:MAG: cation transporter [Clostridia bacterium]|nr:cation transporter [Clostridia bacterium]
MTQKLIDHARARIAARTDDVREQEVQLREYCGKTAGLGGLAANFLLFAVKITVGLLASSVSVMADGLNNLSDAGSSLVTLIGFKMAAAPPDQEHPFGHGRVEYLSTMLVAVMIIMAGYELIKSALDKILHPAASVFTWVTALALVLSILVKLWMALFYRGIGRAIRSQTLMAAFADSRNDIICTLAVLVSAVVEWRTGWRLDGYMGLLVAVFVLWSGFNIIRKAISPLLGQAPDPELTEGIRRLVLETDGVLGIHDLIVHDYGPGRRIVSLHAEVPSSADILVSHDRIDQIEQKLMERFHVVACIHMDPIDTDDERIPALRSAAQQALLQIDPRLSLHDFRVVFGDTHTNLIFDIEIPFGFSGGADLPRRIQQELQKQDPTLCVVANVEYRMS